MAPMTHHGASAHGETGMHEAATLSCLITTLYDVIAAIQDRLSPDDDALVVATVVYLLQSGRLTWLGKARERLSRSRREAM
jgi:hypothetical protein